MAVLAVTPEVSGVAAKKGVGRGFGKGGTLIATKTLLTSILLLAAAVLIFLAVKNVLCRSGAWSFGIC